MTRIPLIALLLAACGGSDDGASPEKTSTSDETTDPTQTDTDTETDTDTSVDTETSTTDTGTTDTETATGTGDTGPGATGDTAVAPDCSPPDEDPEPTSYGHPADGWRWAPQGPLFADILGLGLYDGDLAPTLVDTGSELRLMFTRTDGDGTSLLTTTSSDGVAWAEPEEVQGIEFTSVTYPSLSYSGGTFHLYEGSGSIGYATSTDGVTFVPGQTVLWTSDAGDFASLSMLYPHPVEENGGVTLWYTGFNGVNFAIGHAASVGLGEPASGGTLEMEPDPKGWDNAAVGMPMVVDRGGVRHFWYGGYDTVVANPGPWRVGYLDPTTGERQVALELGETGEDAWSTRDPAVVPWGDGWLMVYVGLGDDGVYRLLSATSDVCNE